MSIANDMSKPAKKTHFVMVTFGTRHSKLERDFRRLTKKTGQSDAGQARELIAEALEARRLAAKKT